MILVHEDSYKVILRKPLSGREIHLPPIRKTIYLEHLGGKTSLLMYVRSPKRFVFSVDPDLSRDDDFVLMMTWTSRTDEKDSLFNSIAFFKSGNEDWVYIEELTLVEDIVYVNGLFYVLKRWKMLYSISCDDVCYKVRRITPLDHEVEDDPLSYLVESPEGDLLGINVRRNQRLLPEFKIYKLVWFSKNPRWEQVMSLGDVTLFLGNSRSISVTASDFPGSQTPDDGGCFSNSIYFFERGYCHFLNSYIGGPYVFHVNDRSVTRLPIHGRSFLWISPKFM